jgi:hypothetical protein
MTTGGHQDPAAAAQNPTDAAGSKGDRFVLDEAAFWQKMMGTIPPDVRWDG